MNKNIKKIQSMIKGNYRKPQVGYTGKTIDQRKEGEQWTDANGRDWIKEKGKRKQITNVPGIGFNNCKDCDKLILKQRDEDTYNRMQRCFVCQIDFENDLKTKGKWQDWVAEHEKMRWESMKEEMVEILREMKESSEQSFDKTVAHSIGNFEQQKNKEQIKQETT